MTLWRTLAVAGPIAWLAMSSPSFGSERAKPEPHGTIVVLDENDSDYGYSDRDYTNGLYGSWTSANLGTDDTFSPIANAVMLSNDDSPAEYRHGYFLGQSMFTPENLKLVHPNPKDHPYGGWLF